MIGFVQALNIAWDSRSEAAGGQRWFDLRAPEEITPDDVFYWKIISRTGMRAAQIVILQTY